MEQEMKCKYRSKSHSKEHIVCLKDGSLRKKEKCHSRCPKYTLTKFKRWFSENFYW